MDLLDLEPIMARLVAAAKPPLRAVVTAADLQAMREKGGVIGSPTAGLMFMGAHPYPPEEGSGPLRQTIDATISVVIAVKLAGTLGAAGLKTLAAPTAAVRLALFGWEHPDAVRKFWLGDEGIDDYDPATGLLFYRIDFTTRLRIQEP